MPRTLIIVPADFQTKKDLLEQHREAMLRIAPGEETVLYYAASETLALRTCLLEGKYDTIVVAFPSLSADSPPLGAISSLAPRSAKVLYCPDIRFLKGSAGDTAGNQDSLARWFAMGRALQDNMCRQADAIITETEDDRQLLGGLFPDTIVRSCAQAAAGVDLHRRPAKKVSIIILTFNQLADTKQCVESLHKHTTGMDYELIFVDNGSTDATRAYLQGLREREKNVRVILNDANVGFARANNQGMKIASGKYLLLLNNDVILTAGWLEKMLSCAESDPAIGVVGPCTNHAVGQQVIGVSLELNDADIQKFAAMQSLKHAGQWRETHRIIGFCMLVKREVIERVGMLDERFGPGGFEDYDFCLRVTQGGYRIMIAGDVFIYHIGGQGYHKNNLDYDKLRYRNIQIFIDKWSKKSLDILETMPDGF